MKAVVQRVKEAQVIIDGKTYAKINYGYLIYLGIKVGDRLAEVKLLAKKIKNLRIISDQEGKMNLSLEKISGEILVVSQFTLNAELNKGNRPSFILAARPDEAIPLYEKFIEELSQDFHVKTGVFGADMEIHSINDGPVTILYETEEL